MEIVQLYESILDAGGLISDKDGFVSVNSKKFGIDKNTPCLVGGKRLVLPTDAQLRSGNNGERIVFHPLSENILRGESEVVTKLRSVLTIRLNYTIATLVNAIIDITQDTDKHKYLSPEQSEILSVAPDIDEKSAVDFTQLVLKVMNEEVNTSFISIYLKRSGTIGTERFSRIGVVSFPFYEELIKDEDTCLGVKLRKKDRQSFKAIFEYILPKIGESGAYNRGSDSDVAPFLDALMKTFMSVGSKLNDVVELLGNKLECKELLVINSEWVDSFDNLSLLMKKIRLIPMQLGNEGAQRVADNSKNASAGVQTIDGDRFSVPCKPADTNDVYVCKPNHTPPPLQYSTPEAPAPVRNIGTVMQNNQQYQQPVQQQQQSLTVRHTSRGVDFDSIMRPGMQQTFIPPSMFGNQGMPMQQQQFMPQQNPNGPRSMSNTMGMQPFPQQQFFNQQQYPQQGYPVQPQQFQPQFPQQQQYPQQGFINTGGI